MTQADQALFGGTYTCLRCQASGTKGLRILCAVPGCELRFESCLRVRCLLRAGVNFFKHARWHHVMGQPPPRPSAVN